jgi:soluble lytic murein transglycosylase-like protein
MSRARYELTPETAAAAFPTQGRGCFTGYLLPPLAVLVIGTLLAIFAFTVTPAEIPVQAAASTPLHDRVLDSAIGAFIPSQPRGASSSGSADTIPAPPAAPPSAALQMTFVSNSVQAAPASSSARLSPVFTPEVQYWGDAIARWSRAAGIDPNLAATVMQIESCGDPSATSGSGAMGLFQVMPFHFASSDSPYAPDTNAVRGLDYLHRSLSAANNDARLAFAGYNGGIGVIGRSEWAWPAETIRYAYWGSGIYADAISGKSTSSRLNEWLAAGGSGLCSRAGARLGIDN